MPPAPDTGESPLLSLIRQRRSCRAYAPGRIVPRHCIEACLEAARLAPSACNRQPWRFVVVQNGDVLARIRQEALLPGLPHTWLEDVPALVALGAELKLVTHRLAPAISGIPYYLIDLGIAGEHFVLAATELGLGTCWIGWFDERAVKRLLHIPRGVRVASLIALGYPAETQRPQAGRQALEQMVSWDAWGNPSP